MIPPEDVSDGKGKTVTWADTNKMCPETLSPDHVTTDQGPQLTPLGRYQVIIHTE